MPPYDLHQMCPNHIRGVHHGVTFTASLLRILRSDPQRGNSEGRFHGRDTLDGLSRQVIAGRPDGELTALPELKAGDFHALQPDGVFARAQRQIVGDAHRRQHVAQLSGKLFSNTGDAAQQRRVRAAIHHADQSQTHFNSQRLHFEQSVQVVPDRRLRLGRGHLLCRGANFLAHPPAHPAHAATHHQERKLGHSGQYCQKQQNARGQ